MRRIFRKNGAAQPPRRRNRQTHMNCRPCMVPGTPPREKSASARLSAEKNPGFALHSRAMPLAFQRRAW